MKITVIGGSSRTGQHLLQQALAAGHLVTAVVRTPAKVTVEAHTNLDVVAADMLDPAEVEPHVLGRDAVIFCLGHNDRRPSRIMHDAIQATIWAMHHCGTRRLLAVSASGFVFDPNDGPLLRWIAKPLLGQVLKNGFDDMKAMEAAIVDSDLDWTIVSPPRLTTSAYDGRYRVNPDLTVSGGSTISRANLAACLLVAAEDPVTVGRRMFIAK